MNKVIFEFENRLVANILATLLEKDETLLERLNEEIAKYNDGIELNDDGEPEEDALNPVAFFSVDLDSNDKNVEHIITCEYE